MTDLLKRLRIGELTVVGGLEGQGKSLLVQQIAWYVAKTFIPHNEKVDRWLAGTLGPDESVSADPTKLGVLYCTLEMPWPQLYGRALVQFDHFSPENLTDPTTMSNLEWDLLHGSVQEMRRWPVAICDAPRLLVSELPELIEQNNVEWKTRLLVVDYLQMLTIKGGFKDDWQRIDALAKELKEIALRYKLHILTPAALSRDRNAYLPSSQQLRGGGGINYNADNIWILHRPGKSDPSIEPEWEDVAVLNVEKARQGGSGLVHLRWNAKKLSFETMSRVDEARLGPLPTRKFTGL